MAAPNNGTSTRDIASSRNTLGYGLGLVNLTEYIDQLVCHIDKKSSDKQICGALGMYIGVAQNAFFGTFNGANQEIKDLNYELNLSYRSLVPFCDLPNGKYATRSKEPMPTPANRDELRQAIKKDRDKVLRIMALSNQVRLTQPLFADMARVPRSSDCDIPLN